MIQVLTRSSGASADAARHLVLVTTLMISGTAVQARELRAPGEIPDSKSPATPAMLHLAVVQSRATEVGSAYSIDPDGHGTNPRHDLELAFTPEGVRIEDGDRGFGLRLERFGRGEGRPARQTVPRIDGAWVELDRGAGLTEWFVNLPRGVEQGWTLARRPAGRGPLVLELDTVRPPDAVEQGRLSWSGLVYHRLVALDANGRELPATWAHDGARLRIEVDDRGADYPLLVDPWVQQAKLIANDGEEEDRFGDAVAIAGDTALVGAATVENAGAAYVFTRSDGLWSLEEKLTPDDGAPVDLFGQSVALAGDTALVGARFATVDGDFRRGAAYVFTRLSTGWSQQDKLTADDGAPSDFFGFSVALAGDTALVGARAADLGGNAEVGGDVNQGAAYVFVRTGPNWSEQDKLTATDGAMNDFFGASVAVAGNTALVGAAGADVDDNDDQGAAYVFTRNGGAWSLQDKLTGDDGAAGDRFGVATALDGDTALVGAVFGDSQRGAAYVFTRDGVEWSQQDVLTAADGAAIDRFGTSVAVAGDTAVVGASSADVGATGDQGAAYVFTRSGDDWSQQAKLTAGDGAAEDSFGDAVAFAGGTALVGAYLADVSDISNQGAAYVYVFEAVAELAFDPSSLDFGDVELGADETRATTLLNTGGGEATGLEFTLTNGSFTADTSACGGGLPPGESCSIDVTFTPTVTGPITGSLVVASVEGATAELGLSGNGVDKTGVFVPVLLTADPEPLMSLSDGNLVFEPGEQVQIAPAWRHDGGFPQFLDGTATGFTGPVGPTYTLVDDQASYGEVEPGTIVDCRVTGMCYQMEIGPSGVPRPALHWDTLFDETLTDTTVAGWTLHVGDSFTDVPRENLFYRSIETLVHHGVNGDPELVRRALAVVGCSESEFCPVVDATRAQAAVFLLQGLGVPTPPDCVEGDVRFADVPADDPFCPWIEALADLGATAGCGGGNAQHHRVGDLGTGDNFCPGAAVSRAQMAVLLLKTLGGSQYEPPDCNSTFTDVICPSPFADWIEDLHTRGITAGCAMDPPAYCPGTAVTRAQLAALVVKTFGLILYGAENPAPQ